MSKSTLFSSFLILELFILAIAASDLIRPKDVDKLSFSEDQTTPDGESKMNCYDDYLQSLCFLFRPQSIDCSNKNGKFRCSATLSETIYIKNYQVVCEDSKELHGLVDPDTCFVNYTLEQNALNVSGPVLVGIMLSTIVVSFVAACLTSLKKHRSRKIKRKSRTTDQTPILIHLKQPEFTLSRSLEKAPSQLVNHAFAPIYDRPPAYSGYQNYNTTNPNSQPNSNPYLSDQPPKYSL